MEPTLYHNKDKELVKNIFDTILKNNSFNNGFSGIFSIDYLEKDEISSEIESFVKTTYQKYVRKDFLENKFYIQCKYYNKKGEFVNNLGWHNDDYTFLNSPVWTVIYYLENDSLKGGNFLYKLNGKENKIVIKDDTILSFEGKIIHKPEELKDGELKTRKLIVMAFGK